MKITYKKNKWFYRTRTMSIVGLIISAVIILSNVFRHMYYHDAYDSMLQAMEGGLIEGWFYIGRFFVLSAIVLLITVAITIRDHDDDEGDE